MSLCDTCAKPGACCKGFKLFVRDRADDVHTSLWLDEPLDEQMERRGKGMYVPSEKLGEAIDPASGRPYGWFSYQCAFLTPEGRCGQYEKRPDVCRDYQAGSSTLCVHYREVDVSTITCPAHKRPCTHWFDEAIDPQTGKPTLGRARCDECAVPLP